MSKRKLSMQERVDQLEVLFSSLEKGIVQMGNGVNSGFNTISTQFREGLQGITEIVMAILKVQGEEYEKKVMTEVAASRTKRAQFFLDKAKNSLNELVESGVFVKSDSITKDSLIVGRELDKNGNETGFGYAQVEYNQLAALEGADALLGQGPGYIFKYPDNEGTFEVQAIYNPGTSKKAE